MGADREDSVGGRPGTKMSPAGHLNFLGKREAEFVANGEENDMRKH